MTSTPHQQNIWFMSKCLSIFTIVLGGLVLIGWTFNSTVLKSILPGIVPMNPHTALCFVLIGTAFLLMRSAYKGNVLHQRIIIGSAIFVFVMGFARMLGIAGVVDLHLDQIIFHKKLLAESAFAFNRIAPNTSLNLMLIAISTYLVYDRRHIGVAQILLFATFMIAILAIIGYVYQVKDLYGFFKYTPMALNTAIAFLAASIALMFQLTETGFVKTLASDGPEGVITRRMVPVIIFAPAILGWLRLYGQHEGLYPTEYGTALFVVAIITVFLLIVFRAGKQIAALDEVRLIAEGSRMETEHELMELNSKLDAKLAEQESQNNELGETKRAMLNLLEDINLEKEKILEAQAKDEALLGSIGDGVFAVDLNQNIVVFNPVAEALSGYTKEEVMGKPYAEYLKFIYEDKGLPNTEFVTIALGGTKTEMANHTMLVTKEGAKIPVSDSAAPVRDANGTVTGAVIVFRDVTREREVDKAKTEFVSLASHQLRTPLTAIGWYTEMLLDGDAGKISASQQKFLKEIADGNARMVDLVNALLNVSRIELGTFAVDPEPTDLVALAESVIAELHPTVTLREQTVVKSFDATLEPLSADPKLTRMMFQNLLSNASKYTQEKGTITLSVENVSRAKTVAKQKIPKDSILISVSDNGYGVPREQQTRIFEKLFRADNVKEKDTDGTGLGLYIIKSIVDQVGGQIWFESPVKGTTAEHPGTAFYIALPKAGMAKKEGSKALEKNK